MIPALAACTLVALAPSALAMPPYRLWRLQAQPRPIFPHVRLLREARVVEFDGQVAIHAHAADGSVVFLEVIACRPDTKEHESLVVSPALASHVHAALLLLGAEPGHPGGWEWQEQTLQTIEPAGSPLHVTIAWIDSEGARHEHAATDLVVNRADGQTLTKAMAEGHAVSSDDVDPAEARDSTKPGDTTPPAPAPPSFVFAGSRFVTRASGEVYDADGTGLIVGLHTFGSETIAFHRTMSPEAAVEEPEWIARRDLLPARGTAVVVRIHAPN